MTEQEFKQKVLSLSDRLYPMVARMLGNEALAEDAVQDIMIKLWDRRKQINKHPNIAGFVFLTARNYCLDILKKPKPGLEAITRSVMAVASHTGHDQLEWNELTQIVEKVLDNLPEQQRTVMIMRDLDGFEFTEIAAVTELTIEHVRVLLSRARKQVSKELRKIYCDEPGEI